MQGILDTVRALLRRALGENGQNPPALTEVVVERARAGLGPRIAVHFANGYRASECFRPSECHDYCERHGAWEVRSLQRALLDDTLGLYEQMREDRGREWYVQRHRSARQELDDLIRTLRPLAGFGGFEAEVGSKEARRRGLHLLGQNLTPEQRKQYAEHKHFDVIGGRTGRRYRIRHGRLMNIEELAEDGSRVGGLCFHPRGRLVAGDVMLAQKLALELFEPEALGMANRY
jgi:hypothetical protein